MKAIEGAIHDTLNDAGILDEKLVGKLVGRRIQNNCINRSRS